MSEKKATKNSNWKSETKHSMKRRSPWHDYYRQGTYMLTLVVEGRLPLFGSLKGNKADEAYVELSPLGQAIHDEEIKKISLYFPQVSVWKLCIMPDHLHLILHVKENLPKGKHLGQVVAGFKGGCSRVWNKIKARANAQATVTASTAISPMAALANTREAMATGVTVPSVSAEGKNPPTPLFEPGYNDKILFEDEQLENWKAYLDENPVRLWLKKKNPEAFAVMHGMEIAGRQCNAVGNRFLLSIPDKVAVIVHRRYTDEENARLKEEWLTCGERGGVLVSAAIAPKEKEVLREAMDRGYRIILLRKNGFPELYKPSGEAFYASVEGRLLQISPWDFHMESTAITREQCLELNRLAEEIAAM